jgi:hypothetical protein
VAEVLSRRVVVRLLSGAPALLLSACAGHAAQAPTVLPTATAIPTPALAAPPTPQASPVMTPTMAAPTVTATPSAAPSPTAIPSTPTPGLTPTSAVAAALNAEFPTHQFDFALRPLLFQIDNAPDARPQSGLSSAYAVYETLAEGGITRFTALFLQQRLADIGNLRSARLVDIDLTQQWDGVLVHVGASTPVQQLLQASGITQLDLDRADSVAAAYRTSDRIAPYNLYTSLQRLRPFLAAHGVPLTATEPRAFPVGALPASIASTAGDSLTIPYGSPSTADYAWDAPSGGYRRSTDGSAVIDANTGEQVVVTNAVVQFAKEIVTTIIEDAEGSHSLQFVQTGSGKAVLLRNQRRFNLTWRREKPAALTTFAFADGSPATFAPGNVWISFVPDSMQLG